MVQTITAEQKQIIMDRLRSYLTQQPEVLFAYLHGSFVGERPFRDIDVAVFVDRTKIPLSEEFRYELDVGARLDLVLTQPVDLRVLNDAPLAFRYMASRGFLLMCRDEERLTDYLVRTWMEYFDFAPFSTHHLWEVLSG